MNKTGYNSERMYTFIRGFASGAQLRHSMRCPMRAKSTAGSCARAVSPISSTL